MREPIGHALSILRRADRDRLVRCRRTRPRRGRFAVLIDAREHGVLGRSRRAIGVEERPARGSSRDDRQLGRELVDADDAGRRVRSAQSPTAPGSPMGRPGFWPALWRQRVPAVRRDVFSGARPPRTCSPRSRATNGSTFSRLRCNSNSAVVHRRPIHSNSPRDERLLGSRVTPPVRLRRVGWTGERTAKNPGSGRILTTFRRTQLLDRPGFPSSSFARSEVTHR